MAIDLEKFESEQYTARKLKQLKSRLSEFLGAVLIYDCRQSCRRVCEAQILSVVLTAFPIRKFR